MFNTIFISFIFIIFALPSSKWAGGNDKNPSSSRSNKPGFFKDYPIPTPGRWYTYKCGPILMPNKTINDERIIRVVYSLPFLIKYIEWIPRFTQSGQPIWETDFKVLRFSSFPSPLITLLKSDPIERAIFLPSFDMDEEILQSVLKADKQYRRIINPKNPPECRLDMAIHHRLCVLEDDCHLHLVEPEYNILWYDENRFPYK